MHHKIETLLTKLPPRALGVPAAVDAPSEGDMNKAGILLFLPEGTTENWRFCVMRPVGRHPEKGTPQFQLPKGTRMEKIKGEWVDVSDQSEGNAVEPLSVTAIREGIEEVGLKLSNLAGLWDVGAVSFESAKTGKRKWMWVFAGEMKSVEDFLPRDEVAPTTLARAFYTLAELEHFARADHVIIIKALLPYLKAQYP